MDEQPTSPWTPPPGTPRGRRRPVRRTPTTRPWPPAPVRSPSRPAAGGAIFGKVALAIGAAALGAAIAIPVSSALRDSSTATAPSSAATAPAPRTPLTPTAPLRR